jgi:coenzyme F420-reducing hydrogenase beta subunit
VTITQDEKGFYRAVVDNEKCVECGMCKKICPQNKDSVINFIPNSFYAYAVQSKNEKLLEDSSSGAVMGALSEQVISSGGVVYGVVLDEHHRVVFDRIDSKENLYKLQGSKYAQAYVGHLYKNVRIDLRNGINVLFTGTPCQVDGLKRYLNEEYQNLITVDFICHGVSSPKVWEGYISYFKKKYDENLQVSFRDKCISWNRFSLTISNKEKRLYSKPLDEDIYLKAFLKNITIGEFCSKCEYRGSNHYSDITVADFWGVEKYYNDFKNNKGTSVAIINSTVGKGLMLDVLDSFIFRELHDYKMLLSGNPTYMKSHELSDNRQRFFDDLDSTGDTYKVLKKYTMDPLVLRVKKVIKKILGIHQDNI